MPPKPSTKSSRSKIRCYDPDTGKPVTEAEFEQLSATWRANLATDGFKDIEDPATGKLKEWERRTIAFDNREVIQEFFTKLTHYITDNSATLPAIETQILTLYSQGVHVKGKNGIVVQVGKSRDYCHRVINKHKAIVLGTQ